MKTRKFLPPLIVLVISGALLVVGLTQPPEASSAYTYPNALAIVMAVLSVLWLAAELRTSGVVGVQGVQWRATLVSMAVMVFYLALIRLAGMLVASAVVYFGTAILFQAERVSARSVAMAAISTGVFILVIYLLFNRLLQLQSPGGFLGWY